MKKGINIYPYLLLMLLLAIGTLLVMQAGFLFFNRYIFHIDGLSEWIGILWGNVVFGCATVATFLAPYFLLMLLPFEFRWKRWCRIVGEILYIVPVLIIIIPRAANMAYYPFTYRLLSDEIFSYLGISGQMGALVPLFAVDYWYAWVLPLCLAILFLILNHRLRFSERNPYAKHTANDLTACGVGLLLLWLMARGGFGHFIQPTDAARYCQPKNSALVNNDAYNIFRTLFTPDLKEVEYMSADEAKTTFNPEYIGIKADSLKTRNVVVIILESFGQEFMGCYNCSANADTRTPFLDSLATMSTLYDGRSNGKKSIEGITAINTGIPNLMSIPLVNSAYNEDIYTGLPGTLRQHGYRTAFFHGGYNGTMDFDKTCAKIGFDEYHGMNEYNASEMAEESDYDGVWGIYDEPFLKYTLQQINTYNEPFFAEVFTVTSHHPFPIPDKHKGEFKEGCHPILKCVEYTDYALRQFFNEAKKQAWYENTLFVILGDHSGQGLTPEYNDYDGWYRIPMIVFDPQCAVGRHESRIVQQTDLYPTLVDMLGTGDTIVCFGTSAVSRPKEGWQVYYGNGWHCLVSGPGHDITVIMGNHEGGSAENIKLLKAIIQQYNNRIINNKLIKL